MRIESYEFGRIVIDGRSYTHDVIIFPNRVEDRWWRKKGHELNKDDINEIVKMAPEILVIGTGNSGLMQVPNDVRTYLKSQGIMIKIEKTQKACEIFNQLAQEKRVIAALHLTC
ncbi:MAG: Mth938-like domain-containing protein [Candidatus Helarchaeota archaeon]